MGDSKKRKQDTSPGGSKHAPPRKRSRSVSQTRNRGEYAKQLLKSLVTLDSYEQDASENVQLEGIWNEANESSTNSARVENASSKQVAKKRAQQADGTAEDSVAKTDDSEELEKEQKEKFEREEAARDAALPEEYRKFRPRGYGFKLPPTDRPVRIYADGVFDLFHLGHMKQLEQAKKSLPNVTMIVGIPNDKLVHKYKGLTVLTDEQRYESLRHCRWVDEVIPSAPWEVNQAFLDDHKIDYVAHDDAPYAGPNGEGDVYKFVKERGQFLTTQRTDGISTSDIITKIVKNYDLYLMRNFKRGVSRKELNVSWIKKNELDIKRHVNAFRESWKHNVETTKKDLYADLLSFALNAPPNSVLGRARDWVSRKYESRQVSPSESPIHDGTSDNNNDDDDDDDDDARSSASEKTSQALSASESDASVDREDEEDSDEQTPRPKKTRRQA